MEFKELIHGTKEHREYERQEQKWRDNLKAGDKVIRYQSSRYYGYGEWLVFIVKRVTKTKIALTWSNEDDEMDFRKDNGREFTKYTSYYQLLSPSPYNYWQMDQEKLEKDRLELAEALEGTSFSNSDFSIDALQAIEAIIKIELARKEQKKRAKEVSGIYEIKVKGELKDYLHSTVKVLNDGTSDLDIEDYVDFPIGSINGIVHSLKTQRDCFETDYYTIKRIDNSATKA